MHQQTESLHSIFETLQEMLPITVNIYFLRVDPYFQGQPLDLHFPQPSHE